MKKLTLLLATFLLLSVTIFVSCGGNPTPSTPTSTTPPPNTKPFYSIIGIPSNVDTSFDALPITVFAPTKTIQVGTMLYSDFTLNNPVKFQYFKVGGIVYYSPTMNGQFSIVPQGGGNIPPRFIK